MNASVSIITPAFNSGRTIEQTIRSVQGQTFQNWELIIVDDCSTDDTCAIVENFRSADRRIRLLRQHANGGPAQARNAALKVAAGRYVAFLDSDDYWLSEKLERQLSFMSERQIALSYTLYRRFRDGSISESALAQIPSVFTYRDLLKNTGIACLTVMIDTDRTGPVQFSTIKHEDYVLWLSLLKRGFVALGLMEDLARYRVSAGSVSGNKLQSAVWVWNIYRTVEKLNLPNATWCFLNYAWNSFKRFA